MTQARHIRPGHPLVAPGPAPDPAASPGGPLPPARPARVPPGPQSPAQTMLQTPPRPPADTVWGGVAYFPRHPDADMHGLVRAVCRARLFSQAIHALSRYGVEVSHSELGRTWGATLSRAEQTATLGRYGEVLVSSLARAYLTPTSYRPVPRHLMIPYRPGVGRVEPPK